MVSYSQSRIPIPRIWMVVAVELFLVFLGFLLAFVTNSVFLGSMMTGAAIETVGRAIMVFHAFRFLGASKVIQALRSFRRGELQKFLLCTLLFSLVFSLVKEIRPAAVFVGYGFFALLGTVLAARLYK